MSDDLALLDATAQAELVATGEATAQDLCEAAIARIERLNPDLNAVIQDAVEIARPKWQLETTAQGRQIDVDLELGQILEISGNVYELTQVVNNLVFNAVEAMPQGGRITIGTSQGDDGVVMRVADTGTGMDEETRKKLFEPFFTTKETGQGLGTSIIFGIVSRHRGTISVESEPGLGTTFQVWLPLA